MDLIQALSSDPAAANVHRYFAWGHLPEGPLRQTSSKFGLLADDVMLTVPQGPERTVALRKLLEAKDAAARACVPKEG